MATDSSTIRAAWLVSTSRDEYRHPNMLVAGGLKEERQKSGRPLDVHSGGFGMTLQF